MNSLRSPLIFLIQFFYLMSPKWGSHHEPKTSFKKGIENFVNWYKNNGQE